MPEIRKKGRGCNEWHVQRILMLLVRYYGIACAPDSTVTKKGRHLGKLSRG